MDNGVKQPKKVSHNSLESVSSNMRQPGVPDEAAGRVAGAWWGRECLYPPPKPTRKNKSETKFNKINNLSSQKIDKNQKRKKIKGNRRKSKIECLKLKKCFCGDFDHFL